jgi:hypothetical protein
VRRQRWIEDIFCSAAGPPLTTRDARVVFVLPAWYWAFETRLRFAEMFMQKFELAGDERCVGRLAGPATDIDDIERVIDETFNRNEL